MVRAKTQILVKGKNHSVIVQEQLFQLGYVWGDGSSIAKTDLTEVWIIMFEDMTLKWQKAEDEDLVWLMLDDLLEKTDRPDNYNSLTSSLDVEIDWKHERLDIDGEIIEFQALNDLNDFINKYRNK